MDEKRPLVEQEEGVQRLLGCLFSVIEGMSAQWIVPPTRIHLSIPSSRLEELQLVSEETRRKIQLRTREALRKQVRDTNTISLEKTETGIAVRERYTDVVHLYRINGGHVRLDHVVEEIAYLERAPDGSFTVRMEQGTVSKVLHAFGEEFIPKEEALRKRGMGEDLPQEFTPIGVTPRRLNTTLALVIEGYHLGAIK